MIQVGDFVRATNLHGPSGAALQRYQVVAIHSGPGHATETYEVALGGGSLAFLNRRTCVKDGA